MITISKKTLELMAFVAATSDWTKDHIGDDEVDILMYPRKYRSDSNKIVYYYCASAPKRTHVKEFLKNFWKLVGRK